MTNEKLIAALQMQGDDLWASRAVSLVETLGGTGIDAVSPTLLDDMLAARGEHRRIDAWLDNLPGLSGGDRSMAEEQLRYLTMQFVTVAA